MDGDRSERLLVTDAANGESLLDNRPRNNYLSIERFAGHTRSFSSRLSCFARFAVPTTTRS